MLLVSLPYISSFPRLCYHLFSPLFIFLIRCAFSSSPFPNFLRTTFLSFSSFDFDALFWWK
jgi:hypothetical protein